MKMAGSGCRETKGPFNQVSCEARLFTPDGKAVVTPNSDTPYCMFWMNLRAEPPVLSVPEMEEERYCGFQLIDLCTHNFAYVGSLTTGGKDDARPVDAFWSETVYNADGYLEANEQGVNSFNNFSAKPN